MTGAERPTSVLDASAVLALLDDEPGSDAVSDAIADGAAVSVVNWAEVLSKLAERGLDPRVAGSELRKAEGSRRAVNIEPFTAMDCVEAARLRPITKSLGLSLADRACLVLATRLGVPAVTSDGAFAEADIAAEVILIR